MIPIIEEAVLGSDLDGRFYSLLNIGSLVPVPDNLAQSDDPRLSDERLPVPGSVTDESVASDAAIVQSKLSLDGAVPPAWLGNSGTTAAPGDQVEYIANRNVPGGYAGLDASGKVLPAQLPGDAGTGTVTSVGLTMPPQFSVAASPVTAAGTIAVGWASTPDMSWFGNKAGTAGPPQFYNTPLPVSLIPNLDSSMVTSGTFAPALLPLAVGVGASHAPGAVPDPGATGLATDYLARDMTYKPAPSLGPTYQPTIPNPVLSSSDNITGGVSVTVISTVSDALFFYSFVSASTGFQEFPEAGYVSLAAGSTIWVYAAHPGYNNSAVVSLTNSNPP